MYRFNSTAQFFFLIPARAADGATVCKVNCYSNEFSLRMAFNSRNVFFLAATIFEGTSPQDNPKGNLDGKFQNKTK